MNAMSASHARVSHAKVSASKVVRRFGGRFSAELGIDVASGDPAETLSPMIWPLAPVLMPKAASRKSINIVQLDQFPKSLWRRCRGRSRARQAVDPHLANAIVLYVDDINVPDRIDAQAVHAVIRDSVDRGAAVAAEYREPSKVVSAHEDLDRSVGGAHLVDVGFAARNIEVAVGQRRWDSGALHVGVDGKASQRKLELHGAEIPGTGDRLDDALGIDLPNAVVPIDVEAPVLTHGHC